MSSSEKMVPSWVERFAVDLAFAAQRQGIVKASARVDYRHTTYDIDYCVRETGSPGGEKREPQLTVEATSILKQRIFLNLEQETTIAT